MNANREDKENLSRYCTLAAFAVKDGILYDREAARRWINEMTIEEKQEFSLVCFSLALEAASDVTAEYERLEANLSNLVSSDNKFFDKRTRA